MTEEKDPTGMPQNTPGAKLDAGKAPVRHLKKFALALFALSVLSDRGALKYSEGGFKKVSDAINRYDDALGRHWLIEGEEVYDTQMGVHHAVSDAWNALARLDAYIREHGYESVFSMTTDEFKATLPRKVEPVAEETAAHMPVDPFA